MGRRLDHIDAQDGSKWAAARQLIFSDPLPFFAELREERPVWNLGEVTLVSRFHDCMDVLGRPTVFGVDLYEPKQGGYFMAQDDTAVHWREKSLMKAVLDVEEVPLIRDWVGQESSQQLEAAPASFDLIRRITRGVPVELVRQWFGFTRADPDKLIEWSYWNQQDAFWNQPFDHVVPGLDQTGIVAARQRANVMMALYLGRLVLRRSIAVRLGSRANDPTTRIIRLALRGGLRFGRRDALFNIGGLLIGAVETTSHAVCNALTHLRAHPDQLAAARVAACSASPEDIDGHVFEALRWNPAFPYFFRICHRDTQLGDALVRKGTTVLAVTHSAMFDPAGFPHPNCFDPQRELSTTFTFGTGHHACLGRHIALAMVPEILRQILRRGDLDLSQGPDHRGSSVPQHWQTRKNLPSLTG